MTISARLRSLELWQIAMIATAIIVVLAHALFHVDLGWALFGAGPVTLAQAKLNTTDDVDLFVIDEFRKSSFLLDAIPFDQAVSPAGGGATLTYGYTRQITQRAAAFRAINAEYTPTEATKARYTTELKPLGGSFQIDRVLAGLGAATASEIEFQMRELIKAAGAKFSDAVINGDTAVDANGFDGLSKALAGSVTEYLPLNNGNSLGYVDWTTVTDQNSALAAMRVINTWLGLMNGRPDAILGNAAAIAWFTQIAALSGQLRSATDAFGTTIDTYNGIPLVNPGEKAGVSTLIIPTYSGDPDAGGPGGTITGLTDLFAVRFGMDAFHGVAVTGPLIKTWLPDFSTAGAVKTGEAEMGPVSVALKATKAAAVLRNIKVA